MKHSDFQLPSVPPKVPLEHPMTKYNTQNNLNMSGGADTLTVPQDLNASETTNSITENLSSLIKRKNLTCTFLSMEVYIF